MTQGSVNYTILRTRLAAQQLLRLGVKRNLRPFTPQVNPSKSPCSPTLRDQRVYDLAVDVGQSVVATLKAIGQTRVIEAHQVQDGGL